MNYNQLGRCGLKVGQFSLGAGSFGQGAMDVKGTREALAIAFDGGINYFDNAESYGNGASEEAMGAALQELGWSRVKYIVSTKFFWGTTVGPNEKNTLNRKYLLHAIDGALRRLQVDYVDIVYCHRPDPHTPIEETVWAMHNIIERGKAVYWGTSEWSAQEIRAAWDIAERHHLHKPVVEQPEYSLLKRRHVETEYPRLCRDIGLGLAIWSPLAGGVLSGKYRDGIPADSRAVALKQEPEMHQALLDPERNAIVSKLATVADELNCSLAHLALAWCTLHPHVSTVLLGASRPAQVADNLRALDVIPKLTPQVQQRLLELVGDYSQSWIGNSPWHYR